MEDERIFTEQCALNIKKCNVFFSLQVLLRYLLQKETGSSNNNKVLLLN